MSAHTAKRDLVPAAALDVDRANLVMWFVLVIVAAGLVSVVVHRFLMQRKAADSRDASMTRPVLAVLLVGSALIFAAASLTFEDQQLRNLLVGGVISLSSAAVAFYFASSTATDARRDLLAATADTVTVPALEAKTLPEAHALMSHSRLTLSLENQPQDPADIVTSQEPHAGATARAGTAVTIRFGP